MGFCDIPKVNKFTGLILMIVNIFLPGVGSIIGAIINEGGCDCGMLVAGVVQLIFAACILGWVWSIYVGCKMGCCRD